VTEPTCNVQVRPGEVGDIYDPSRMDYPLCDRLAITSWASRCPVCEDTPGVTTACLEHALMFGPSVVTVCACGRVIDKSEPVSV
jgi:hypothetical protein